MDGGDALASSTVMGAAVPPAEAFRASDALRVCLSAEAAEEIGCSRTGVDAACAADDPEVSTAFTLDASPAEAPLSGWAGGCSGCGGPLGSAEPPSGAPDAGSGDFAGA